MSSVFLLRLVLDLVAAGLLLFGLSYWWLGNTVHELSGAGWFLLVIVHNGFNRRWYGEIAKARRDAHGLVNIGATFLLLIAMLVLLGTSALISNTLRRFIALDGGLTLRQIHTFAAYWVLVIAAIHLGFRWPTILGVARMLAGISQASTARAFALRAIATAIAIHGVWSSFVLGVGAKLSMQITLDWWNFEESVLGFFRHCIAIVGLYIFLIHYASRWIWNRRRGTARALAGSIALMALFSLIGGSRCLAQANGTPDAAPSAARDGNGPRYLGADDTIRDILRHPAFAGFGHLILPWDGRAYDEGMHLRQIGSLLPYHSNVDPQTIVQSLNRMIDDAARGQRVFYDIYTEAEKRADPSKANTGLFFFRGRPGAPFAIVSPGGGFAYVGAVHEGFPYAEQICKHGYNAFVLRYRAEQDGRIATEDLAAAITFVFRNAGALEVGRNDYSLWGSSAGARMAAMIGSHGVAAFGGDRLPRPSVVVMAYTAHADYVSDEPPTFVIVGGRDGIAPPSTMAQRVAALRRAGTKVEFHEYPGLGHGFGPGTGTVAAGWIADATRFWQGFMRSSHE